jgi:spore coat polysaccharide biosynthesis protein SpsF
LKAVALITARMGSSRLPGKHILKVGELSLLEVLIGRMKHSFADELRKGSLRIVIATTSEPQSAAFSRFAEDGVDVAFGPSQNIPYRHLLAAQQHHADIVLSVDGDDIMCSPAGMRDVLNRLLAGSQWVECTGLPLGMNSSGYRTEFLRLAAEPRKHELIEVGWTRIFEPAKPERVQRRVKGDNDKLRLTLDYEEDYRFFSALITALGAEVFKATDQEIVDRINQERLFELNKGVIEGYWQNYNRQKDKELERE